MTERRSGGDRRDPEDAFLDALDQRLVLIDNQVQAVKGKLVTTRRGLLLNIAFAVGIFLTTLGVAWNRNVYGDRIEETRVRSDTQICQAINNGRERVNAKFDQLADLFDASIAQSGRAPTGALAEAYEAWKAPIPLLNCSAVVHENGLDLGDASEFQS